MRKDFERLVQQVNESTNAVGEICERVTSLANDCRHRNKLPDGLLGKLDAVESKMFVLVKRRIS